ncbi:hypothetical protein ACK2RV_000309 [Yersinia enterocolitica]
MGNIQFESKRVGGVSLSKVKIDGVEAVMKQVGGISKISTIGRGNVRQAKSICRELHQIINTGAG